MKKLLLLLLLSGCMHVPQKAKPPPNKELRLERRINVFIEVLNIAGAILPYPQNLPVTTIQQIVSQRKNKLYEKRSSNQSDRSRRSDSVH